MDFKNISLSFVTQVYTSTTASSMKDVNVANCCPSRMLHFTKFLLLSASPNVKHYALLTTEHRSVIVFIFIRTLQKIASVFPCCEFCCSDISFEDLHAEERNHIWGGL